MSQSKSDMDRKRDERIRQRDTTACRDLLDVWLELKNGIDTEVEVFNAFGTALQKLFTARKVEFDTRLGEWQKTILAVERKKFNVEVRLRGGQRAPFPEVKESAEELVRLGRKVLIEISAVRLAREEGTATPEAELERAARDADEAVETATAEREAAGNDNGEGPHPMENDVGAASTDDQEVDMPPV